MSIQEGVLNYFKELNLEIPDSILGYLQEIEDDFSDISEFMVYLRDDHDEIKKMNIMQNIKFDSNLGRAELSYYQTYTYVGEIKYALNERYSFIEKGSEDLITAIMNESDNVFDEDEFLLFVTVKIDHVVTSGGENKVVKTPVGHLYVPERVLL